MFEFLLLIPFSTFAMEFITFNQLKDSVQLTKSFIQNTYLQDFSENYPKAKNNPVLTNLAANNWKAMEVCPLHAHFVVFAKKYQLNDIFYADIVNPRNLTLLEDIYKQQYSKQAFIKGEISHLNNQSCSTLYLLAYFIERDKVTKMQYAQWMHYSEIPSIAAFGNLKNPYKIPTIPLSIYVQGIAIGWLASIPVICFFLYCTGLLHY